MANNIPTRTRKHFQEPTRKESLEDELKRVKKELATAKQERDIRLNEKIRLLNNHFFL